MGDFHTYLNIHTELDNSSERQKIEDAIAHIPKNPSQDFERD